MTTWLVTGGSGFLGRHLLATLKGRGPRILAIGRRCPEGWPEAWFAKVDLEDGEAVRTSVEEARPEVVIHAAGRTPPASAEELERGNARMTATLSEALASAGRPARLVVAGSAAEFGPVDEGDLPVRDDHPCRPVDAYGASKLRATAAALASGPPVEPIVARIFNATGPGAPPSQAFGRFARALAAGSGPCTLEAGDLDARRDFVDARDVAEALVALATSGRPGFRYNVGTGRSRPVGEGLQLLIAMSGRPVEVRHAPAPRRGPADSRADIARICGHTGWRPRVGFAASLLDLWREAVAAAGSA